MNSKQSWFQKLFLNEAKAAIESRIDLQEKTVSDPGTYSPDEGYEGFSKITVDYTASLNEVDALLGGE